MMLLRLYWEFFQVGLFAVGGGLATLPFLYSLGTRTGWFTTAQVADMLAVSESTPGPIGINMATYVGFTVGGPLGSLAATLGVILPGIALVLIVMAMLAKFRNNRYVDGAFYGIRPASVGLIIAAGLLVAKITFFLEGTLAVGALSWKAVLLAAVLLVLTRWVKPTKKLHPVVFIAASAVVGVLFSF